MTLNVLLNTPEPRVIQERPLIDLLRVEAGIRDTARDLD